MKAVVIHRYGPPEVLQEAEIERPSIQDDQMLVKVRAASVNPIDWKIRQGRLKVLSGWNFPLVLGFDLAGEVVKVGRRVTRFRAGDLIYACLDQLSGGAYAEYAAVAERVAAAKPQSLSYEQAAAVPLAGLTALQALRDQGRLKAGQSVLVNGASSGVGTFAVQIAKVLGDRVTGVCSSKNLELVKSLGADQVIDYTQQDFTQEASRYDIVFDVVGKSSFLTCQRCLTSKGVYITTQPLPQQFLQQFLTLFSPGKKAKVILLQSRADDLAYLSDLIEAGKLRSVIDRVYSLSELAAAHTYSETEHAAGKIVIAVDNSATST